MKRVSVCGFYLTMNLQLNIWQYLGLYHDWLMLLGVPQRRRVVVLTFRNLLSKGTFGAQMVDLGLPQIVQSLKAQAWSDEDLLEALNQLEDGLKDNIKKLSSSNKYKQEVLSLVILIGHPCIKIHCFGVIILHALKRMISRY